MAKHSLFAATPDVAGILMAGVEEAGRGPLAGGVYAAAVILAPARPIDGLSDSKVLAAERREELSAYLQARHLAWWSASAIVLDIAILHILRPTFRTVQTDVICTRHATHLARVHGNPAPP